MLQQLGKYMLDLLARHPGKVLGASLGLLVGLLVLMLGVFKALFLLACVIGGLYVGARIDDADNAQILTFVWKKRDRWGKQ